MDTLCAHCGEHLSESWIFCARCGAHLAHEGAFPEHPNPEPAPATGAFSGLLFGFIAVPLLLIVGTMLCLTGLGAVLGVPMIIAGVLAPLIGPLLGMGVAKGKVL